MIIELYPQYQLFKFTLLLNDNKEIFIKPQIESRAVNGTIINRAYYSAYSYALLWLEEEIPEFKIKQKWEYDENGEEYVSEHKQVRDWLNAYKKNKASNELYKLHNLRKKADYKIYNPLTQEDMKNAIKYMNNLFDELKFQK